MIKKKKNDRIRNTSYPYGLTELAARSGCLKKIVITAFVRPLVNGVLCGLMSRKNTGYKRKQVFDVVCIEIAYTTATVMLRKFKRMPSPYYISNIVKGFIMCWELKNKFREGDCQYYDKILTKFYKL